MDRLERTPETEHHLNTKRRSATRHRRHNQGDDTAAKGGTSNRQELATSVDEKHRTRSSSNQLQRARRSSFLIQPINSTMNPRVDSHRSIVPYGIEVLGISIKDRDRDAVSPRYSTPCSPIVPLRADPVRDRINETKGWVAAMKTEVAKDARQERQEERRRSRSRHKHRSSSAMGKSPLPVAPERAASKDKSSAKHGDRRPSAHTAEPIACKDSVVAAAPVPFEKRFHENSHPASSRLSTKERSADKMVLLAPTPVLEMSSVDDPIFNFCSFLDGNTFHSTAALCDYNVGVAEALSDAHLAILRAEVFESDEPAFAELLYGDDAQAELNFIETMLAVNTDPRIRDDVKLLQAEAIRRFNKKAIGAQQRLMRAGGGLPEAVQQAAGVFDRVPLSTHGVEGMPY